MKEIIVTGAGATEVEKKVVEMLAEQLKKDGIKLILASSILYNAESLEKVVALGNAVLLERAEVSLYNEVEAEIDILLKQDVDIIGCVVVY